MAKSIGELIAFVGSKVVFNEANYPSLGGASEQERLMFALKHSALHFSKTAGKLAAAVEDADHGNELDTEVVKTAVWKSLVNTFWLAEKLGMTEEEILEAIEKKYQ